VIEVPAPPPSRIPLSSYRLQFHPGFRFRDAAELAGYLSRLGITEFYCSPVLAARPGSLHGYDICDHSRLNPELGSPEDFDAFTQACTHHNLGVILDFVPNHMGIDPLLNPWWKDVLESGPSSPYAKYFDIDWDPVKSELHGKVLLPVLGDQYGVVLENGQLQIRVLDGEFSLQYFDNYLPLNPRQMQQLLRHNLPALEAACGADDSDFLEFLSILFHLENLPAYTETDPERVMDRFREKQVAHNRLAKLMNESERIRRHVEENVRRFNGRPGDRASYDLLHELLEAQAYRLSYWRTALHEINYRRFFDINDLAAIRMEDPEVFEAAHAFLLELIRNGVVTGLRLDHVDGLFNPGAYFQQLESACGAGCGIYLVGEKILSATEPLRSDWRIHGTTGYDFLNDVNGLFVNSHNAQAFRKLYARFSGEESLYADVAYESKKLIITSSMVSELNMLARELNRISEVNRSFRDFTLSSLQEALREVVACFPDYRTYCTAAGWDEFDRKTVETAVSRSLRRNPAMEASIFDFIRQLLLPTPGTILPADQYPQGVRFAMKFQQYTGPVQAKGLEDTAFYRYGVLLSLNEVGGDPARFGRSPEEFHHANQQRQQLWPQAMLATATHDTKRGEDARARLNILSEIPQEWRTLLFRWARMNAGMRTLAHGAPAPDRSDEYMFYQALVSAWPPGESAPSAEFADRMRQFMLKATREEKVHTSWINPVQDYDDATAEFVRRTLIGSHAARFLKSFAPFAGRVAWLGMINSLSQLVLKIASPGMPDFYQGTEFWDLSLVDPDNRRPVDFKARAACLSQLEPLLDESCSPEEKSRGVSELLSGWQDARIKMYFTTAGLRLRKTLPELFLQGSYLPLAAEGDRKDHVVAFARIRNDHAVVAVVPRLVAGLTASVERLPLETEAWTGLWKNTSVALPPSLADKIWHNVFTGENARSGKLSSASHLSVPEILRISPVALLRSGP
jgi:(1->4)-alpha-D-glucan 1-alpha-D-glucosylmutase